MSAESQFPSLDYLTRDYEGFRRIFLGLLDQSGTPWTERSAADVGIMLSEMLAAAFDRLAYAGDRVAAEGFLQTSRQRESVRRHALLGDYYLDRGSGSRGVQRFEVTEPVTLPAGTRVSPPLSRGQEPESRLVFETVEKAELDPRRNRFRLARSAGAGTRILQLRTAERGRADLRALGLRPLMQLALLQPTGIGSAELVTVSRIQDDRVELAHPLQNTYRAERGGSGCDCEVPPDHDAARVYGNLVRIRCGKTTDWRRVGIGGLEYSEGSFKEYACGRILQLKRLREAAESLRTEWSSKGELAAQYSLANREVLCVLENLRGAASFNEATQRQLLDRLECAAERLRTILRRVQLELPKESWPSHRVPHPNQTIELRDPELLPPLWFDADEPGTAAPSPGSPIARARTLEVRVGEAAVYTPWSEVEDFLSSTPEDRHYIVRLSPDGWPTLQFGDGTSGALLPVDSQVMVRWVEGDPQGLNIGAGALVELVDPAGQTQRHAKIAQTENPLGTAGARRPEALSGVADRLRRALEIPVVPVTLEHYQRLLKLRSDLADFVVLRSKVATVRSGFQSAPAAQAPLRVEVVALPKIAAEGGRVLESLHAWLAKTRLCGTDVWVRLAAPLYVSIELIVEALPGVSPSDLRMRILRELTALFGDGAPGVIGRSRYRSEIYRAVEAAPGVAWSQVTGFDVAERSPLGQREEIIPSADGIVRCLNLPEQPLCGTIRLFTARRYSLRIKIDRCVCPSDLPNLGELRAQLMSQLSGPGSVPLQSNEPWSEITQAKISDLLQLDAQQREWSYVLSVQGLSVGQDEVDSIPIADGDVPILDRLEIHHAFMRSRES